MKVKVIYVNEDDSITFTKEDLEKLLDEVYDEGYKDGKSNIMVSPFQIPSSNIRDPITNPSITWCEGSPDSITNPQITWGEPSGNIIFTDTVTTNSNGKMTKELQIDIGGTQNINENFKSNN